MDEMQNFLSKAKALGRPIEQIQKRQAADLAAFREALAEPMKKSRSRLPSAHRIFQ
jgi:hypothetical protein